jgi:DNA-binding NarL/FixJ family response regulator
VKVIVLSDHANYEAAISAFQAGARGFLLRNDVVDDLIYGVHKVAAGGAILAPSMLCRVIDQLGAVQPVAHEDPLTSLTDREREVLRLLATGLSNAEIAHALWVQEATVKSHVSRMLGKLGLRDRVQAAALAHRSGMIMSLPHRVPT